MHDNLKISASSHRLAGDDPEELQEARSLHGDLPAGASAGLESTIAELLANGADASAIVAAMRRLAPADAAIRAAVTNPASSPASSPVSSSLTQSSSCSTAKPPMTNATAVPPESPSDAPERAPVPQCNATAEGPSTTSTPGGAAAMQPAAAMQQPPHASFDESTKGNPPATHDSVGSKIGESFCQSRLRNISSRGAGSSSDDAHQDQEAVMPSAAAMLLTSPAATEKPLVLPSATDQPLARRPGATVMTPPTGLPRKPSIRMSTTPSTHEKMTESALVLKPAKPPLLDPDNLPQELDDHQDAADIRNILNAPYDASHERWMSRAVYNEETVEAYNKWSNLASAAHRDAYHERDALVQLEIPADLITCSGDEAARAWEAFRASFILGIIACLKCGVPWDSLLRRLLAAYMKPDTGHVRLKGYVQQALRERTLLAHPCLHADLIIYKLDESFSSGSSEYGRDSVSADWEKCVERPKGEDPISLAKRVVDAYLRKIDDRTVTTTSVWSKKNYVAEINKRYASCLLNDRADPDRGEELFDVFMQRGLETQARLSTELNGNAACLSCVYIARVYVVPAESVYEARLEREQAEDDDASTDVAPSPMNALTMAMNAEPPPARYHRSRPTGRGSRDRRLLRRASERSDAAAVARN